MIRITNLPDPLQAISHRWDGKKAKKVEKTITQPKAVITKIQPKIVEILCYLVYFFPSIR